MKVLLILISFHSHLPFGTVEMLAVGPSVEAVATGVGARIPSSHHENTKFNGLILGP